MSGLTNIQSGDTDGSFASGDTGQILPANATPGNCVAVLIYVVGDTVLSVSSDLGDLAKVNSVLSPEGNDLEWWVVQSVSSAANTIVVTTVGGSDWAAQATEWSGGVSTASDGGNDSGNGPDCVLDVPPGAAGYAVLVGGTDDDNAFIGGPDSSWTDYDAGVFIWDNGLDVTWQVAPNTDTLEAVWDNSNRRDNWAALGLILAPAITGYTVTRPRRVAGDAGG